ncbi:hypothetical protein ACFWNR_06300 [Streptomyces virginiae]|uniref:hypothetical protein n=1 Tax=Streptomyces virginiae TaxID=1961 RepID=UPI003646410D
MTSQLQAVSLRQVRRAPWGCNLMWEDAEMTDEERATQQAAIDEIERLTATFRATERAHEQARDALHEAIIRNLMTRTLRPSQVERHGPYDRNHVGRIAKAAGVPPLRERKTQSAETEG